ncbi:MAG: FAD synthetase family protein [Bacteroidota bacterium]
MRVYESLQKLQPLPNAVVTMGTFDGVHLGHQKLLQSLKQQAKKIGGETVLITFWPHPRIVLGHTHAKPIQLLTTFEEKAALIAQMDINHVVKLPFNKAFAQYSAQKFIEQILVPIGTKQLLAGYNHRFGKDRKGNAALLQQAGEQYHFTVEQLPPVMLNEETISSTKIRQYLLAGDLQTANTYLGRPYTINCAVLQGKPAQQGGGLKVQLAAEATHKLIPHQGIYTASILREGVLHEGELHIAKSDHTAKLVLHLPTLEGTLYDHGWSVQLHTRLR